MLVWPMSSPKITSMFGFSAAPAVAEIAMIEVATKARFGSHLRRGIIWLAPVSLCR
ncbi:hypothetical protein D3C76_1452990 [compost metagenome]